MKPILSYPTLLIAWRFIASKKRSTLLSLCGVIFGISFFIITQAQTSGFEEFFIKTIIETNGAIRIADRFQNLNQSIATSQNPLKNFSVHLREGNYVAGITYPDELRKGLETFRDVTGISEIVEAQVVAKAGLGTQTAIVNGVRLKDHLKVSGLERQIVKGDLIDFQNSPNGVLLGKRLAERLHVNIGDSINLQAGNEAHSYSIKGMFETGVTDIDKSRIYMNLNEARSLLNKPFGEAIFQISIQDPTKAPLLAQQMEGSFYHHATSWQEREKVWLDVFKALRISAGITVMIIIVIAGLGIFNSLVLIVLDKTKEIAILRSMGYTRYDIISIFLSQGIMILVGGIILGYLTATVSIYAISRIPLRIRGIFSTEHFVVSWDPFHYLLAAFLASIVVVIASYFPARRAANLESAKVLRGISE